MPKSNSNHIRYTADDIARLSARLLAGDSGDSGGSWPKAPPEPLRLLATIAALNSDLRDLIDAVLNEDAPVSTLHDAATKLRAKWAVSDDTKGPTPWT